MKTLDTLDVSREAVGVGVGALMLLAWPLRQSMLTEPAWLLGLIVFLSSVGGFIAGAISSHSGFASPLAVRHGVWAAAAVGLTAASVFTLMVKATITDPAVAFRALIGGLLSIMPGTFYGMIAAGVSALILGSRVGLTSQPPTRFGPVVWCTRTLVAFLAVAAVLAPSRHESTIASKIVAVQPARPMLPPFTYHPPADLQTAQALQWKEASEQSFFNVSDDLVALSHDDRRLAFVPTQALQVNVVDLHSPASLRQLALPQRIDRLVFSPSADRLFVTSSGRQSQIAVVDLPSGQYIRLPQPKNRAMPSGPVLWWRDKEILIATSNTDRLVLNLDSLQIDEASTVASWKEAAPSEKESVNRDLSGGLPQTARWRWQLHPRITSAELPEVEGSSSWPIKERLHLALLHPERDSRLVLRSITAEPGDRFLCAHDGSKAVRVRGSEAHVFYFDLGASPRLKWTVAMPHSIGECAQAEGIEAALKAGTLSALIYAPMTNPLNHAVVGPDRESVKAALKFLDWKEKIATVYVSEIFAPCEAGDVIADVCVRDVEHTELFALKTPHRWWNRISEPMEGSDAITSVPTNGEKSEQLAAARMAVDSARRNKEEEDRKARRAEDERVAALQRDRTEAITSKPSPVLAPVFPANPDETRIRDFVLAHHQKAVVGDVVGMVRDYASKVDHFKNGIKDRSWILRDEQTYHSNHAVLEESVDGEIRINRLPGNSGYSVSYSLRVRTVDKSNNRPGGGVFDVNLIIIETTDGLQIARQRSERKP